MGLSFRLRCTICCRGHWDYLSPIYARGKSQEPSSTLTPLTLMNKVTLVASQQEQTRKGRQVSAEIGLLPCRHRTSRCANRHDSGENQTRNIRSDIPGMLSQNQLASDGYCHRPLRHPMLLRHLLRCKLLNVLLPACRVQYQRELYPSDCATSHLAHW